VKVTVRLFAGLREAAGARELTLDLPDGASVADVKRRFGDAYPGVQPLLERVVCAIDDEYVADDETVREGSEVALIPPVSGGASAPPMPAVSPPRDTSGDGQG
jgi:molybdopterin synthase catalytic subunit